jgi:hypothetical protein
VILLLKLIPQVITQIKEAIRTAWTAWHVVKYVLLISRTRMNAYNRFDCGLNGKKAEIAGKQIVSSNVNTHVSGTVGNPAALRITNNLWMLRGFTEKDIEVPRFRIQIL